MRGTWRTTALHSASPEASISSYSVELTSLARQQTYLRSVDRSLVLRGFLFRILAPLKSSLGSSRPCSGCNIRFSAEENTMVQREARYAGSSSHILRAILVL